MGNGPPKLNSGFQANLLEMVENHLASKEIEAEPAPPVVQEPKQVQQVQQADQ